MLFACVGRRCRLHQYNPLKCPSFLLKTVNQHSLKTVVMSGQGPQDMKVGGNLILATSLITGHWPLISVFHPSYAASDH
jgi:hypothetical protein